MEKELSEHLILKKFPKTADGNRDIPLSEKAKRILEMAIEWNMLHGYISSEFIFIDKKGEVRKISGHSDLAVTNSCYVFNRNPASQTLEVMNNVL